MESEHHPSSPVAKGKENHTAKAARKCIKQAFARILLENWNDLSRPMIQQCRLSLLDEPYAVGNPLVVNSYILV